MWTMESKDIRREQPQIGENVAFRRKNPVHINLPLGITGDRRQPKLQNTREAY